LFDAHGTFLLDRLEKCAHDVVDEVFRYGVGRLSLEHEKIVLCTSLIEQEYGARLGSCGCHGQSKQRLHEASLIGGA